MIQIYNEDCLETMQKTLPEDSIDIVITSPPYNTTRNRKAVARYDSYSDYKSVDEYCNFIKNVFLGYDRIVKPNGVVLFNISYGTESPESMLKSVNLVCDQTEWMVSDIICWKKHSAVPNTASPNKLTRICEFVFVFCRKHEYETYRSNKKPTKVREDTNQQYYSNIYNFIDAENHDKMMKTHFMDDSSNNKSIGMNKATFSSELVEKLLNMYAFSKDVVVYDSFLGTGTTAVACKRYGISCYGSEISSEQCDFATKRLNSTESPEDFLW